MCEVGYKQNVIMRIVFFSNFINHHQANVADELYRLTGGNYTFVELRPIYDWLLKGGYSDLSTRPYVLQAWKDDASRSKAMELLKDADVALFSCAEALPYEVMFAKTGKLMFDVSERWLKRGWINLLSPRLLKFFWKYYTVFDKKNVYKLCSSAFACGDHYKLHSFKNRCYKWGYFTRVDRDFEVEAPQGVSTSEPMHTLMWCARFLRWKHPELVIKMAERLKRKGYQFVLDMYGSGEELQPTKDLAKRLGVEDVVNFKGNVPNEEILKAMRQHEIFLFTSDRYEGWGAVVNESMSNGCAIVASDAVGSVPYLVKDDENGCVFESGNIDSLCKKVEWLLDNPDKRQEIARNAYRTMRDVWSPQNAAKNLMALIENLLDGNDSPIVDGPCSKADPI